MVLTLYSLYSTNGPRMERIDCFTAQIERPISYGVRKRMPDPTTCTVTKMLVKRYRAAEMTGCLLLEAKICMHSLGTYTIVLPVNRRCTNMLSIHRLYMYTHLHTRSTNTYTLCAQTHTHVMHTVCIQS